MSEEDWVKKKGKFFFKWTETEFLAVDKPCKVVITYYMCNVKIFKSSGFSTEI